MMDKDEFAAPVTIHARLKVIQAKGWITLSKTGDARRKEINLTPEAFMQFDTVFNCLVQATSRTRKMPNP